MAIEYNKTTWVNDNTPLNADNMNHIEDGIEAATRAVNDSVTNITAGLYMTVEKNGQTYLVKVDDTALAQDFYKADKTWSNIPAVYLGNIVGLIYGSSATPNGIARRDDKGDCSFHKIMVDRLSTTASEYDMPLQAAYYGGFSDGFTVEKTATDTGTLTAVVLDAIKSYPNAGLKYDNQSYIRMDPTNAPDGTLNFIHIDSVQNGDDTYKATGKCFSITVSTRAWQVVDLDFGGSSRTTHNLTLTDGTTGMIVYFSLTNNRTETYEGAAGGLLSALENNMIACTVDADGSNKFNAGVIISSDGINFQLNYGEGQQTLIDQAQVTIADSLA